jgi:large subunit ribosomal protein L23
MRQEKLLKVLLAPHLSEKSAGQYIFKVARSANKHDIKAAVEALFKVNVKSVNVVNMKEARTNDIVRTIGRQSVWKKAYVVLQAGEQINLA